MLRRSTITGIILLLAGFLILSGCSSNSTDVDNNAGNADAPEFQAMRSAITVAVDSTLAIAMNFTHKPNRYPTVDNFDYERPELGPNDSLLYNYVDDWHVLYVGATGAASYNNVYVDSARFWEGTSIVQSFHYHLVSKLDFIHHQSSTYDGSGNEYEDITTYVNFEFDNWNQNDQVFSGTASVSVDRHYLESFAPVNELYEFDIQVEDVNYSDPMDYSWTSREAVSGTMVIACSVTQDASIEEWDVSVEFLDGSADVTAQIGEVVYQFSMTPDYN